MYICAVFGVLCYHAGFVTNILIALTAVFLAYIGYKFTRGIFDIAFVYINLLLSVFVGSKYATKFYYENISSDYMSLVIGDIFLYILLAFILIFIITFMIIRIVKTTKTKKYS